MTRWKHRGDTERTGASPHADGRTCATTGICAHATLIAQDRHNSRADALVFISMSPRSEIRSQRMDRSPWGAHLTVRGKNEET